MEDYKKIIDGGLKAVNRDGETEKGPFTKVIYIMSDVSLIPLWKPDLDDKVAGKYELE